MGTESNWNIDENIRNFLNVSLFGASIVDPDGEIVFANKSLLEQFNSTEDQFVSRSATDFYANPDTRIDIMQELHDKKFVKDITIELKRDNGEKFFASLSFVKSKYAGEDHYFCLFYDLTERLRIEEETKLQAQRTLQIENLKTLVELGNKTAHQINNPLMIIRGTLELIGGELDNEELDREKMKELFAKTFHAVDRITQSVSELNNITKNSQK